MTDAVATTVRQILARQAEVDPSQVTDGSTLASLGIDSMGLVEVVFAVEEAFDVSVPFNANTPGEAGFDLTSVATIVAAVRRLLAAQKAPA